MIVDVSRKTQKWTVEYAVYLIWRLLTFLREVQFFTYHMIRIASITHQSWLLNKLQLQLCKVKRILLFIVFAANFTGDPKLNLLFINGVVAGVLVLQRYAGKLYKNSVNRALEVLYLLNLLFLSSITLFLKGHRSAALAQEITMCTMVGVSFLLYIFTLCWHMYNYTVLPGQVREKLARVFPKFTWQPPQQEVIVGGAGGSPVQGTQAQPTVSVIDMSELREPCTAYQ